MALPLPNVVADVGPGGPMVSSMRGINALINDLYANKKLGVEAQYAPLTTQAEAASKLAYANLMGPQFLAKLMGNEDIIANMSPQERQQALQKVYGAGIGQGTGNALLQSPPYTESPLANIVNNIKKSFGFNVPQQMTSQNAMRTSPQFQQSNEQQINNAPTISPEEVNNTVSQANNAPPLNQNTFAENVATYGGIKEEGKEAGRIRAKDIQELGTNYENALNKEVVLNDLAKTITSPEFSSIRNLPLGQQYELSYYAKFGTPAQKKVIGKFLTDSGAVVAASAKDFQGQFRVGEQQLLERMKVNVSDPIDVAVGKMQSLMLFNDVMKKRSQLTPQIMEKYHISKSKALSYADKALNVEQIKNDIESKLNPVVTIRNKKTGEVITVPVSEARKNYGFKPNG